jgi:hypothetical protein
MGNSDSFYEISLCELFLGKGKDIPVTGHGGL